MEFKLYKRDKHRIAKELCYDKEVLQKIKDAKTVEEVNRALKLGRDRL